MRAVLLDTHARAWSLAGDARLSAPAVAAMQQADAVLVSPISFFEIAQTVRLGKWPETVPIGTNSEACPPDNVGFEDATRRVGCPE